LELLPFGPLLKGYFHNPFTKIHTCHLLSLLPGNYVLLLVTAFDK